MKLKNLHNATTLIESEDTKFLFDPWLKSDLYYGSWSVADKYAREEKYFTNDITHVFISHIHQDHWDIDTLKDISSDAIIFLPKYGFNNVIMNQLESLNFKTIMFVELGQWFEISPNISGYIIPPLNGMAQELELYQKKSQYMSIAIDTSLIVKDNISDTCHILLGDNTPYDCIELKKHLENARVNSVDSLWFPHNGFAQDYPLCYDNLSIKQKTEISLTMSIKREKSTLKAIELVNPKYLIPHSSEFVLNGPRKDEFYLVHSNIFLDKKKYASRIQELTNIQSYGFYAKDYIEWNEGKVVFFISPDKVIVPKATSHLNIPITKNTQSLIEVLKKALVALQERCNKFNINSHEFADWSFIINTEKDSFEIDFSQWQVEKLNKKRGKAQNSNSLTLSTTENIVKCILLKDIHFDNICISCSLSWSRVPNVFNKSLYDALNFFHI